MEETIPPLNEETLPEGQEMTWNRFKDEKEAREIYAKYKEEKAAKMLCLNAVVVEKEGDEKLTDKMKEHAEEHYGEFMKPIFCS